MDKELKAILSNFDMSERERPILLKILKRYIEEKESEKIETIKACEECVYRPCVIHDHL